MCRMSLRDTHGKSPDTTKCQSSRTFDACRDRILNIAPPMRFKDSDDKVLTLAELWKAVFEQPVVDKERHLEKAVALACLLGPVRFRRRRPDCHDRECLEPATFAHGGRCYCGMHLPAGVEPSRELWPPRTLAQLQEDIGGGVSLSQYSPGRSTGAPRLERRSWKAPT